VPKEWRAWIDTEIAKHVFSGGAVPVYIVEPGFRDSGMSPRKVSGEIARLCGLPAPHDPFAADASPAVHQLRRRRFESVCSFYSEGVEALLREDARRLLAGLTKGLHDRARRGRRR
jgi:hypothetical protein